MAKKVAIVQPYASRYRESLFRSLSARLAAGDTDLEVFAGSPTGVESQRKDASTDEIFTAVRQTVIPLGERRLVFRWLPRRVWDADLLILEQATRNLDTYLLLLWRQVTRRPTAFWGHGHTITSAQSTLERRLQAWMLRRSQWFFAYTPRSLERAVLLGACSRKAVVLNNTYDSSALREAIGSAAGSVAEGDQLKERWIGVYIGGLDHTKRIDYLLQVAAEVHKRDPRFILVIGGRGEDESLVRAAATRPWCHYLGPVGNSEKAWLSRHAKVSLIAGRVGLAAIDSFEMGLPVVCEAWQYHAPEFEYLSEENAFIASPGEMSELVGRVMGDPNRLRSVRDNARASAEAYSHARMVERFHSGITAAMAAG
ncbi:glycosyltransferase family 4 protein [Microbacterium saccharophilum]|uniref:Glycosyltransferase family 4 protein n=1 Tax=Microbacterium saccharophilum TaxID=1213358 RepID=A0A5C8I8B9_9MICO|nr:glycosyltransferase [Microbacterium saccharophilum]TXK15405.1 glycosyltransferase family 4 protein [Microbacterium saccharophilum]GEP47114.1 hypothetical protein MSA03_06220 [Microbacterium saccharophilum]